MTIPVVNYRYESSGPVVFYSGGVLLYRPDGWSSYISTSFADVWRIDKQIERFSTVKGTNDFLADAKSFVIADLEGRGLEPRRIFNWEKINLTIAYYAAAFFCRSQSKDPTDIWFRKYDDYRTDTDELLKNAAIGYDTDDDGVPSPEEKPELRVVELIR